MPWSRREFAAGGAAAALASGCGDSMDRYTAAAAALRADLPAEPRPEDFVRYASLAPNSHNTQPWKFRLGPGAIEILPDLSRRTPVVDPDDHHLFVSLGCAAESLRIAANARGRPGEIIVNASGESASLRVSLGKGAAADREFCNAIPHRQSTRSEYDGRPLSSEELNSLEQAAATPGVRTLFLTGSRHIERLLEFVLEGNTAQVGNPAFVRELKHWIRFNAGSALRTGDGLFAPCSGNPTAPDWLGSFLFDRFFTAEAENEKCAKQLRSSSGAVVFVPEHDSPAGSIGAGQSFQRFALQATVLGIRHAHLNMPVEAPGVRPKFAKWLGVPHLRPALLIRFGKAPPMPMSLRRPPEQLFI